MKNKLLAVLTAFVLLISPLLNFAQRPVLGEAAKYVFFTTTGAIGNTQRSNITGEIGTNTGAVTGFGNVDGIVHLLPDGSTQAAAGALVTANTSITSLTSTGTHAPAFGTEDMFPGVYDIDGDATLDGALTLNAEGDENALFVFRVTGTLAQSIPSTVLLVNGAIACNVFWQVGGVVSLYGGAMTGNILNGAAINVSPGVKLEGRALSSVGAINVSQMTAYTPLGCEIAVLNGPAAPDLLTTKNFGLFTASGAMSNAGISTIIGDVGSNTDNPSGFNAQDVSGVIHLSPDEVTAQASSDLTIVYNTLNAYGPDIELLQPADLGFNLVLTPHTYLLNAATVLHDTLVLNAQGNANAVFVLKVTGAFSTTTNAFIKLINGAQARNVYWKIDGAVDIAVDSKFAGTMVVAAGAIALRENVVLAGRGLTMVGAVSTSSSKTTMFADGTLPVTWLSFSGKAVGEKVLLEWSTAKEMNNSFYTIKKSIDGRSFELLTTIPAKGNVKNNLNLYSYTDQNPHTNGYYSISQTDNDGKSSNYKTILVNATPSERFNGYHFVQQNYIYVKAADPSLTIATMKVFTFDGRLLTSQIISLSKDMNTYKVNKPMSKGVHLLQIESNGRILYNKKVMTF